MSSIPLGSVILDQFRIDEFIDSGGMGSVFRVWDLKRNVPLAMKVLHGELAEDPSMFKRFKREARALEKLAHPNIVPFYGLYQTRVFSFILERFIDGPTLKDILKQKKDELLSETETIIYLKAICSALGYAHANGVVHCDVKPANVMVDNGGSIYLADFGIARHSDSTTTTMTGAGTPAYMAPEQILSKSVSQATDVYAIGVMLYEMLTGQRPFKGNEKGTENAGATANERIRYGHINLDPPNPKMINPSINPKLADVTLKALAKEPANRFQTCQELFNEICSAIGVFQIDIPDRIDLSLINWLPNKQTGPSITTQENILVHSNYRSRVGISMLNQSTVSMPAPLPKNWIFYLIGGVALISLLISLFGRSTNLIPSQTGKFQNQVPIAMTANTIVHSTTPVPTRIKSSPTPMLTITNTDDTASVPWEACVGVKYLSRLRIGDFAKVSNDPPLRNRIRTKPSTSGEIIGFIDTGEEIVIVDGPGCSSEWVWWWVRSLDTGLEGWTSEGDAEGYWLIPVTH